MADVNCVHGQGLLAGACLPCGRAAKSKHAAEIVRVEIPEADGRSVRRCLQCGRPGSDVAHWTAEGAPVDGPYAIHVEGTPTGVTLDVSAFVTDVVVALAQGALAADFLDVVDMFETPAGHDGHARERLLVEQLVERLQTRIPVYGTQGVRLAESIRSASLRALSEQQREAEAPSRGASEIKHPAMRPTREHLADNPLPEQRTDGAA